MIFGFFARGGNVPTGNPRLFDFLAPTLKLLKLRLFFIFRSAVAFSPKNFNSLLLLTFLLTSLFSINNQLTDSRAAHIFGFN